MIDLLHPGPEHAAALGGLLEETLAYYDDPPMPEAERAEVVAAILAGRYLDALMAWRGAQAVGYAVYCFILPADGPRPTLLLNELFVSERARGAGVGRTLMARLTDIAIARDCSRIDWTAEASNTAALTFYAQIGADRLPEKRYYRVSAAQFARFRDGLD